MNESTMLRRGPRKWLKFMSNSLRKRGTTRDFTCRGISLGKSKNIIIGIVGVVGVVGVGVNVNVSVVL